MSEDRKIVHFPSSQTSPPHTPGGVKELGTSALARQIGVDDDHLNGHWCSRCQGIWYGLMLEAECPVCGNRNG